MATIVQGRKMPDSPVILPGWFVKVLASVSALLLPWAAWMTMAVITLTVKIDAAPHANDKIDALYEHLVKISERLVRLESQP